MRDLPPDPEPDEPDEPVGTLHPVPGWVVAVSLVLGMVAGRLSHPVVEAATGYPPMVTWGQPLALVLVAAIMSWLAWHTWRTVQVRGVRLDLDSSVNRFVLARACAVAGALFAGAWVGYAVGWIGDPSERADQWILRAVVGAAASGVVCGASLILERACRTPGGTDRP